jgi:hypothetical protein
MLGFVIVGVEVNVEVQRRAEALNQRNCTGAALCWVCPACRIRYAAMTR